MIFRYQFSVLSYQYKEAISSQLSARPILSLSYLTNALYPQHSKEVRKLTDIDHAQQDAYYAKPDGSAIIQAGTGKIEAVGSELHISGKVDFEAVDGGLRVSFGIDPEKLVTEKRP